MPYGLFSDLRSLCDHVSLPLIDLREDIRLSFPEGPDRQRILKNLEAIQASMQMVPDDYRNLCEGILEGRPKIFRTLEYTWSDPSRCRLRS